MDTRESTTKLLRAYYEAFNRADWGHFLSLLSEDVAHDVNEGGREVGREAFARFMERMNRCYAERIRDVCVMVDSTGTRASCEYIVDGVYKTTDAGLPEARGQSYSLPGGAFFEIRAGKVARVTNYYNLKDWLEQVTG